MKVMIRRSASGALSAYVPKKDLEEPIVAHERPGLWGGTVTNDATAKDNYNDADTTGFRAALRYDLNDNWTLTPTVMAQRQKEK